MTFGIPFQRVNQFLGLRDEIFVQGNLAAPF